VVMARQQTLTEFRSEHVFESLTVVEDHKGRPFPRYNHVSLRFGFLRLKLTNRDRISNYAHRNIGRFRPLRRYSCIRQLLHCSVHLRPDQEDQIRDVDPDHENNEARERPINLRNIRSALDVEIKTEGSEKKS